jgi:hypothetical protein
MTRWTVVAAIAIGAASLLAACNHAKSPTTVAKDVSAAEQSAAENNAKVEEKAAEKVSTARNDLRAEQREAMHVASSEEEKLARANAEGDRKVALAKCEAFSGEQQKACKDQASAAYDVAVAGAKQDRAITDPKQ